MRGSAIMPQAEHEKWVQADLGRSLAPDQIVLVPARPVDFPDTPGFGFPLRYRVELSDEPRFEKPLVVFDQTAADAANPGDVPVRIASGTMPRGAGACSANSTPASAPSAMMLSVIRS